MWDDYYGAQPNPYEVEDFERILAALKATDDGSRAAKDLIERTERALKIEKRGYM